MSYSVNIIHTLFHLRRIIRTFNYLDSVRSSALMYGAALATQWLWTSANISGTHGKRSAIFGVETRATSTTMTKSLLKVGRRWDQVNAQQKVGKARGWFKMARLGHAVCFICE
jgi:site-specific recombinase